MTHAQFLEQDNYCREKNVPDGLGCASCPAMPEDRGIACADSLRNLCGKFSEAIGKADIRPITNELQSRYGFSAYNILALTAGVIEFPE
jgi:hypothetical protein